MVGWMVIKKHIYKKARDRQTTKEITGTQSMDNRDYQKALAQGKE